MGENTEIAWAHHTHSPWEGCTKVSPACDNCYAEVRNQRFYQGAHWGPHADRRRMSRTTLNNPMRWNREAEAKGERYRVFPSLCDPFDNHKSILPEWRAEHFQMMRDTPHLDHLLLTKRPENIRKQAPHEWLGGFPKNVWLGATAESQVEANLRMRHLAQNLCAIKFVSCEPMLSHIDLTDVAWFEGHRFNALTGEIDDGSWTGKIGWVIAGGESGPNYRNGSLGWFRSLRDQCVAADVPFLFKQHEGKTRKEIDAKGRELDGVLWNEFPEVNHAP